MHDCYYNIVGTTFVSMLLKKIGHKGQKRRAKSVEMNHMLIFFFFKGIKRPKHGESYVFVHFLLLSNKKKWQSFHIQTILGINVAEKKNL